MLMLSGELVQPSGESLKNMPRQTAELLAPSFSQPRLENINNPVLQEIMRKKANTRTDVDIDELIRKYYEFDDDMNALTALDKVKPAKCDEVLTWYRHHGSENHKVIARMARDRLSVRASTANVERLFSALGDILSRDRLRMSYSTAERLITTQHWLKSGVVPTGRWREAWDLIEAETKADEQTTEANEPIEVDRDVPQ